MTTAVAKQNMTLRIDPTLRQQASLLYKSMGMDISTATRIFYRQSILERKMPFEIKASEDYNRETLETIEKTRRGEDVYGPYANATEMMKAIDADD